MKYRRIYKWSAVKKRIESLMVPGVEVRPPGCPFMSITYNKEVVWRHPSFKRIKWSKSGSYHWPPDGDELRLKRNLVQYINTPVSEILDTEFDDDKLGYMEVLKLYDRRISKRRRHLYEIYCKLTKPK